MPLNCFGNPPNWITYIRYNAIIVLYPIGVFPGEMWLMYKALPYIKKDNLYADKLPFSYYNFVMPDGISESAAGLRCCGEGDFGDLASWFQSMIMNCRWWECYAGTRGKPETNCYGTMPS